MKLHGIRLTTMAVIFLLIGLLIAAEYRAQDKDKAASLVGVVRFDGPRPIRTQIQFREKRGKLSDCHKLHEAPLLEENTLVSETGAIANVFVYVKRGLEKRAYPLPKQPAVLNQDKCMFRPRVQGIRVGQEFLMRNSDPVLHNVRSFSFKNRAFNIAQPADTEDRKKILTMREKAVMVQCDIHPWMTAYFFVMDHPFFAVSDDKGQFTIEGLPAGEYTLGAWHEEFGEQNLQVTVGASGTITVDFTFSDEPQ